MRLFAALAALLLTAGLMVQPATAASSAPAPNAPTGTAALIAHRALYNLTMASAKSGDVIAAHGTMGYEVTDACDGWAVRQRLRMTITNSEGQDIEMASDYTTWESKDGLKFRYHMRQTTDTAVTSQTDGEAHLEKTGGTGEAKYSSPHDTTSVLPEGTLFPMAHTAAIIQAAREKKRFLTLPLFDGTDENGVEDSFIVILDWKPPMQTKWAGADAARQHACAPVVLRPRTERHAADLRGGHALLGERRRRRHEDGFRRLRDGREDEGIRPAAA